MARLPFTSMLLITGTMILFMGDNYPLYGVALIILAIWIEIIVQEEED